MNRDTAIPTRWHERIRLTKEQKRLHAGNKESWKTMRLSSYLLKFGCWPFLDLQLFCSNNPKKVREKSRECHNHKPQPFPDPKEEEDTDKSKQTQIEQTYKKH